jgi:hypothetical protein
VYLCAAILLGGAALRVWQYAARTSLWLDELALARNILDRPLPRLLGDPLAYDQVAPPGFLLAERLVVLALGDGELQLRLVPFISGLATLPLFYLLAARTLRGAALPLGVALFALAEVFVRFAALAKQCEVDLAVGLVLAVLAVRWREGRSRPAALALAIAGLTLVWFSFSSIIVIAAIGVALLICEWVERGPADVKDLWPVGLAWGLAIAGAAAYGFLTVTPATREFMRVYWERHLLPTSGGLAGDAGWLWRELRNLFGVNLHYALPSLFPLLAIIGAASLFNRRRDLAVLLNAPLVMALGAASVRVYPFEGRLVPFVIPPLLLLLAEAADWIQRKLPARLGLLRWSGIVLTAGVSVAAIWEFRPVYRPHDARPLLERVRRQWQLGDALYGYYAAWQALEYYGPRLRFAPADITIGGCHRAEPDQYFLELDQFRGQPRLWILFTLGYNGPREKAAILTYLDVIGTRLDSFVVEPGPSRPIGGEGSAFLYLYDLSRPERFVFATAARSLATATIPPPSPFQCRHGPAVPRPELGSARYHYLAGQVEADGRR